MGVELGASENLLIPEDCEVSDNKSRAAKPASKNKTFFISFHLSRHIFVQHCVCVFKKSVFVWIQSVLP